MSVRVFYGDKFESMGAMKLKDTIVSVHYDANGDSMGAL